MTETKNCFNCRFWRNIDRNNEIWGRCKKLSQPQENFHLVIENAAALIPGYIETRQDFSCFYFQKIES